MTEQARVALVTGGGGGIGSAICRSLATAGHRVVVADLSADAAEDVAGQIDGRAVVMDVTDPSSIVTGAALAGPVDICVNCAGWERATPFLDCDDAFIERVIAINLVGAIHVTRAVLGGMIERRWGRVVNVASDAGLVGSPLSVVYSAAKGGLVTFTKAVAKDIGRHGITANVVSPGAIDTPLLASSMGENLPRVLRAIERSVPLGRIGVPEEVAAVAAFFASEEASYVTGQTVSAGGGQAMP